ncbi:hypothetical protein RxyAA322_15560 [Rubrobacter xylanophilus]|uniref:Uncharacterized protein n=1 Tax=Rubrobacter xylanophilus TaxID=49319 RepID=A0A510HI86_9ACTN|nr:hypothetical protein RxyAA322_15560 [Rubrobacter xylanophilus]
MAVPMKLASATWRMEELCPSRSPPTLSTISSFPRACTNESGSIPHPGTKSGVFAARDEP